jgi:phosphonate transport system substrate-binding protein
MTPDTLTFGVLPSRVDADPSLRSLCDRLSALLNRPIRSVRASSYDELVDTLERGHTQLAWMSPLLAALAEDRLPLRPLLVASRAGHAEYRAVLFAHSHSPIRSVDDLEGVSVAWVDRASGSGYLVPRLMIAAAGYDVDCLFSEERFCGSHDEVVRAVCERRVAVGATFADVAPMAPFSSPRAPLRALLISEPIPNDLIMAHGLLPLADAMGFAAALHSIGAGDTGRSLLDDVFGAAAFDFTDGTHLRRIRLQVQLARRLGLLLQM